MIRILIILFALVVTSAHGQQEFVDKGFELAKKGVLSDAFRHWLKDSPIGESKEFESQIAQLGSISAYFGSYLSHEYLGTKALGENNKIIYAVANLENGGMFVNFQLHKLSSGKWTATNVRFDAKPDVVFPPQVLIPD